MMGSDYHSLAFYERDEQFVDLAVDWLAEGLRAGDACAVFATAPHRIVLESRLSQGGLLRDGAASGSGSYHAHDAATTLAQFTIDGWPDPARFDEVVGSMLRAAARGSNRPVRAFGEMVTLLIAGVKPHAAVALEKLWNTLLDNERISLLCCYPQSSFLAAPQQAQLRAICAEHKGVCLP